MPGLDGGGGGAFTDRGESCSDGGEVVYVDEAGGHGDDNFGGARGEGVRLAWELDRDGILRGSGEVVDMERVIPRGGYQ